MRGESQPFRDGGFCEMDLGRMVDLDHKAESLLLLTG